MMTTALLVLLSPLVAEDPVADRVMLRDGSVVLGQVVPGRSRGVDVIVRKAWVEEHLPDRAAGWIDRDRPGQARAIADRLQRLRQWQAERRAPGGGRADPIGSWIEAELARLDVPIEEDRHALMVVSIPRGEVAGVDTQPEDRRRMLRQGWRAGFDDVESMAEDHLLAGLQARGFARVDLDPAPIDDLLPIPAEPDRQWLARRASTEAIHDPDLRLIRYGDLVMPDPGQGGNVDQAQMAGAVGGLLEGLLGGGPVADPMRPHLDRVERSGRIGVVVTRMETSPGFDRVAVETALLIRVAPGRWEPGTTRRAEVRTADLPPEALRPLAEDPQVRAAFSMMQGLGLGQVDAGAQRLGLAVGAATQMALQEARSALEADLQSVAIRIDRGPAPASDDPAR